MPDPATYRIEFDHNRAIVALLPALNDVAWADIEKIGADVVSQLANLTTPLLLVDLTALNYMGSSQVALVVRMFKSIKERGGRLVVANKHPLVTEVLTLAGLNKLWTIVDSRDAALKLLGGGPSVGGTSNGGMASGIGVAALAASVVALVAVITKADWMPERTAIFLELGTGAVAFLSGLMAMLKSSRTFGACILTGSVAVLLAGVFSLGTMQTRATSPTAELTPIAVDQLPPATDPTPSADPSTESNP